MDINILKNTDSELEFEIFNEETLLNPLRSIISRHKDVSFVGFKKEHPLRDKITFVIKGKQPIKILKESLKKLEKEYKDILSKI